MNSSTNFETILWGNSSQSERWFSNTTPESHSESHSEPAAGASIALSVLYGAICVIGLVGNFLVLYAVCAFEQMRTPTNIYLRNMAVSESLALGWLPAIIYLQNARGRWPFGVVACRLFYASMAVTWSASTYTLTAMSADRLMAVRSCTYKANRERCNTISTAVCALIWIVSVLLASPLFHFTSLTTYAGEQYCDLDPDISYLTLVYTIYSFLLCFALPLSLTSIFYGKLLWRLRQIGRNRASRALRRSNRKITQLVLAVVFCYVVCWAPYWTNQILYHLVEYNEWGVSPSVQQLVADSVQLLTYLNSMANPILYAFLSKNFRISFQKAFECVNSSEVNRLLAVTGEQSAINAVSRVLPDGSPRFRTGVRYRIYSERRESPRSLNEHSHVGPAIDLESIQGSPRNGHATLASSNSDGIEIIELGNSRPQNTLSDSLVGHSKSCTNLDGILQTRNLSPP